MGGIEDVCYNIVHYLSTKKDVTQQVICFNSENKTCYDKVEGVDIVRVGSFLKIASQSVSMSYKKELRKVIETFQPDIIHLHVPNPFVTYYLLMLLPLSVSLIVHWHSDIIGKKMLYFLIKPLEKKMLQRANRIVVTSPNYVNHSIPLQSFKNKTIIMPNFISPLDFAYTEKVKNDVAHLRTQYDNKPILLFVGRHVPYKGLQYLLNAVDKIQSTCEIIIGGEGPLTQILKKRCNAPNVHFIGRIEEEQLVTYYYASDIFVFPSITKNEAFGVVLAEAMYCYTPAITFTIKGSGVNWVNVNEKTGFEVENSNSIALANAIDILLKNDNLRKKMAKSARERVEQFFLIDKISDIINQIYH